MTTGKKLLCSRRRTLLCQLRVDIDLDIFADHHRRRLRANAEAFAMDDSGSLQPAALVSALLKRRRRSGDVECHFLSHAMNGEVANNFQLALAVLAHALRLERDRGKLSSVE